MVRHSVNGITIVTGGIRAFKWFMDQLTPQQQEEWVVHDCRDMKKVDGRVRHEEDCFYENTYRVVAQQDLFYTKVTNVIDEAVRYERKSHFVYCEQGIHRCTCVAETAKSHLNSLATETGKRYANCQTFHLWKGGTRHKDRLAIMDQALMWQAEPYTLVEPWSGRKKDIFGYDACLSHHKSAMNWEKINDYVQAQYYRIGDPELETVVLEEAPQTPPWIEEDEVDSRGSKGCKRKHGDMSSDDEFAPGPRSSPVAPSTVAPSTVAPSHAIPMPPPPVFPRPRETCMYGGGQDKSSSSLGPARQPLTAPPDHVLSWFGRTPAADTYRLPDWATFEFSVEAWMSLLDAWQMDITAKQDLFNLAQINKSLANEVVFKLIKKGADVKGGWGKGSKGLDNPSGWLHIACKNAREGKPFG